MAFSEKLADRVRAALAEQKRVEEKKMFRGMCFMVNGKMCVCVSNDDLMCRIDPESTGDALEQNGCRPMIRNGKAMKGYVYVDGDSIKSQKDFNHWISLSLAFNKKAKASKPKQKKK